MHKQFWLRAIALSELTLPLTGLTLSLAACGGDLAIGDARSSEADPANDVRMVEGKAEALAATSGCGDACIGEDPASYTAWVPELGNVSCGADAVTVSEGYDSGSGHTIQLRYSPACRTVWGRVWGGVKNDMICLRQLDHTGYAYQVEQYSMDDPEGRNWSGMWNDANVQTQACVGPRGSYCKGGDPNMPPPTYWACSGFY